VTALCKLIMLM